MTSPACLCMPYSGPFGTDLINPGDCPVHPKEPMMNNQTPPARLPESPRPVCPTGVVPSRLRSDQPTLLQPWTAREEEELQTARAKLQALEGRRNVAHDAAVYKLNTLLNMDPLDGFSLAPRMIQHADAVRDALAPFDSGVRQAGGV